MSASAFKAHAEEVGQVRTLYPFAVPTKSLSWPVRRVLHMGALGAQVHEVDLQSQTAEVKSMRGRVGIQNNQSINKGFK